jgi:hypothetical protein
MVKSGLKGFSWNGSGGWSFGQCAKSSVLHYLKTRTGGSHFPSRRRTV